MISPSRLTVATMLGLAAATLTACNRGPRPAFPEIEAQMSEARWAEAAQACTAKLQPPPADPGQQAKLLELRGNARRMLKQYDAAISDFSQLILLKPDEPESYYLRAAAHREAGETALAFAFDELGKMRDPQHELAYPFHPRNFSTMRPMPEVATDARHRDAPDAAPNQPARSERAAGGGQEDSASALASDPRFGQAPGMPGAPGTADLENGQGEARSTGSGGAGGLGPGPSATAATPADPQVPPQAPRGPTIPTGPTAPGTLAAADAADAADGADGADAADEGPGEAKPTRRRAFEKWLAGQRRERQTQRAAAGRAAAEAGKREPSTAEASPPLPPLSTALPELVTTPPAAAGMRSPGGSAWSAPRTTGLSSQAAAPLPSAVRPNLRGGMVTTGWHSRRLHFSDAASADAFSSPAAMPGQFFGTRPYTFSQSRPVLSTSLPGTELPTAVPRAAADGADISELSTQLPPEKAVGQETLPRRSGLATPTVRP